MIGVEGSRKRVPKDYTVRFFLLTYAITWSCTAIGLADGLASSSLGFVASRALLLFGSFAPSIAALGLTGLVEGTLGIRSLLRCLFDWRVAFRWYVVAFTYPVAVLLLADITHRIIAGVGAPLSQPRWLAIAFSTVLLMPVRASEEIGWRGYALSRLAKKFGFGKAALFVGPVWACWHLPQFLIPGMASYGQSSAMFVLGVTALSVAFAWLYGNTNGSLFPVVFMHSVIDEVFTLLPPPGTVANPLAFGSELMPWLITAFAWLIAVYMLVQMPINKQPVPE